MAITVGKVLKYTLLPGIVPRTKNVFFSGFGYVAFFMACLYRSVRLLPPNHPYLSAQNIGRFGIRHVMAQAQSNLVFKRENIDQIAIHYLLLLGVVLMLVQFVLFLTAAIVQGARAGALGEYYASFFVTPSPRDDIAFIFMDRVFGMPGIFGSKVAVDHTDGPFPAPFHEGLHDLFSFYNTGLLAVGLIVFLYLVVAVVVETAQSGTPFGKRFNHAWAPVRLMLAIVLLTPFSNGMCGAQYLTLYAAKWGSGLATNAWDAYLDMAARRNVTPLGETGTLIASPTVPSVNGLAQFMFVVQSCVYTEYYLNNGRVIKAYIVREKEPPMVFGENQIERPPPLGAPAKTYDAALSYAQNKDVVIRFGEWANPDYENYTSYVKPICGEIVLRTNDVASPGARYVRQRYYELIWELWNDGPDWALAQGFMNYNLPSDVADPLGGTVPDQTYIKSTLDYFTRMMTQATNGKPAVIAEAVRREEGGGLWNTSYRQYGWGGAGMWYSKIAEANGALVEAVMNVPAPGRWPAVMEQVLEQKRQKNAAVTGEDRFKPYLSNGQPAELGTGNDFSEAFALNEAFKVWSDGFAPSSNNILLDSMTSIFGLQGLFSLRKNTGVNPLAQLSQLGRGMVESSVVAFGAGLGGKLLGGISSLQSKAPSMISAAGEMAFSIAKFGFMIGFVLYYVVPFLPFIYFFFAVSAWVKEVFEAMVGLPLWALAHIRIDGEGIPGRASMNGYYLIFEILISPILIIFGLLAAMIVFSAQVQVLNEIFTLVTDNVTGHDPSDPVGAIENLRGRADQFFYTVLYAIVVFMMGMSSFKLIDLIPQDLLTKYLGAKVKSFSDQAGDPAEGVVGRVWTGGSMAMGQLDAMGASLTMRNR